MYLVIRVNIELNLGKALGLVGCVWKSRSRTSFPVRVYRPLTKSALVPSDPDGDLSTYLNFDNHCVAGLSWVNRRDRRLLDSNASAFI